MFFGFESRLKASPFRILDARSRFCFLSRRVNSIWGHPLSPSRRGWPKAELSKEGFYKGRVAAEIVKALKSRGGICFFCFSWEQATGCH